MTSPVRLAAPSPLWPLMARTEAQRWKDALGDDLIACHHIGSTSVPGLIAKPILDLMPVIRPEALDRIQGGVEGMGYEWMGEFGLPGRRYCRKDSPQGKRLVQAHAYALGDPGVARHLAFRDALIRRPDLAKAYARVKRRAAAARDGAYWDLKSPFIQRLEAWALGQADLPSKAVIKSMPDLGRHSW